MAVRTIGASEINVTGGVMSDVQAWRLDPGDTSKDLPIAVPRAHLVEILDDVRAWPVPMGPRWCRELLDWRGTYLPLASSAGDPIASARHRFVAVLVVNPDAREPEQCFAALRLSRPPVMIDVQDGRDCDPPPGHRLPSQYLRACFLDGNEAVAVIDMGAMFGARR